MSELTTAQELSPPRLNPLSTLDETFTVPQLEESSDVEFEDVCSIGADPSEAGDASGMQPPPFGIRYRPDRWQQAEGHNLRHVLENRAVRFTISRGAVVPPNTPALGKLLDETRDTLARQADSIEPLHQDQQHEREPNSVPATREGSHPVQAIQ